MAGKDVENGSAEPGQVKAQVRKTADCVRGSLNDVRRRGSESGESEARVCGVHLELDADAGEAAYRALAAAGARAHREHLSKPRAARARAAALSALRRLNGYVAFAPLIVAACVPDAWRGLLAAACVAGFNVASSAAFKALGVYKVWPKAIDLVNLALYPCLFAAAHTHPRTTQLAKSPVVNGVTALYFWATQLMGRPFCEEFSRESAPGEFLANPAFKELNRDIGLLWSAAMSVATLSSAGAAVAVAVARRKDVYLGLHLGVGATALIGAFVWQHVIVHRFASRVRAAAAGLEAAGGGGGDDDKASGGDDDDGDGKAVGGRR